MPLDRSREQNLIWYSVDLPFPVVDCVVQPSGKEPDMVLPATHLIPNTECLHEPSQLVKTDIFAPYETHLLQLRGISFKILAR